MVVRESAKVLQYFMKTRSIWFPAWWVGIEGETVRSNVENSMNSDDRSFSGGNVTQDNKRCSVVRGAAGALQ